MVETPEGANLGAMVESDETAVQDAYRATPFDQLQAVKEGAGALTIRRGFDSRGNITFGSQVELHIPVQSTPDERAEAFTESNIMAAIAERLAGEMGMKLVAIEEPVDQNGPSSTYSVLHNPVRFDAEGTY